MSDEQASHATPAPARSAPSGGARGWFRQLTGRTSQLPNFGPGDQVRVWYRIKERDRVRLAPFEGLVIRRRGIGASETFTVRRVTYGEGVERVFPAHTPMLDHVEVVRQGRVRRARLYFLRTKIGKTKIDAADRGGAVSAAEGVPPVTGPAAKPAGRAAVSELAPDVAPFASPAPKP